MEMIYYRPYTPNGEQSYEDYSNEINSLIISEFEKNSAFIDITNHYVSIFKCAPPKRGPGNRKFFCQYLTDILSIEGIKEVYDKSKRIDWTVITILFKYFFQKCLGKVVSYPDLYSFVSFKDYPNSYSGLTLGEKNFRKRIREYSPLRQLLFSSGEQKEQ